MYKEESFIRQCINQLKPALNDANKLTSLLYCWDKLDGVNNDTGHMTFNTALLDVHFDEKRKTKQSTWLKMRNQGKVRQEQVPPYKGDVLDGSCSSLF
jgi:hypothetical protein